MGCLASSPEIIQQEEVCFTHKKATGTSREAVERDRGSKQLGAM